MKQYSNAWKPIAAQRIYLTAREIAIDAINRICLEKPPRQKEKTDYHTCPTCGGLLTERYEHCRWCGQKLRWERQNDDT